MPIEQNENRIMEQIRRALAIAEDPASSDNEKETALGRANRLMMKHAIDQALLDLTRTSGEKRVITNTTFKVYEKGWEWSAQFRSILSMLARTNRCKAVLKSGNSECVLVGMREDVEWIQLLWFQIFYEFIAKIDPKWDASKPHGINILKMKEAGYSWEQIWEHAQAALGDNIPSGRKAHYDAKLDRWMMTEYKKTLRILEREPVATQRNAAYRASFTEAFCLQVMARLEAMAEDNKKQEDSVPGSALALADLSGLVEEEYYTLFPNLRPLSPEQQAEREEYWRKHEEEAARKDAEFLASLSGLERKRVLEEREKEHRRQSKENDKYYREYNKKRERLYDSTGHKAGRAAGDEVNLNRTKTATTHTEKKEIL